MSQQMTNPEMNSVHSVKILLCYILDKLNRSVTEEQLLVISEDSEIISYFYFSDAVEELIKNGSITAQEITLPDGTLTRSLCITEKGRLGSEYFNKYIPLVFRKKLLHTAFSFFIKQENNGMCSCEITETAHGCNVQFSLKDRDFNLINMNFYAPDREQAKLIKEKIVANPMAAYKNILGFLLDNPSSTVDIDKLL